MTDYCPTVEGVTRYAQVGRVIACPTCGQTWPYLLPPGYGVGNLPPHEPPCPGCDAEVACDRIETDCGHTVHRCQTVTLFDGAGDPDVVACRSDLHEET